MIPRIDKIESNAERNFIINGNFNIRQRGDVSAIAHGSWLADRYIYYGATGMDASYSTDVPAGQNCFESLGMTVATPTPVLGPGAYSIIRQGQEGNLIKPLYGRKFSIGFWVKTNVAGIYGINLRGASRSVVYEYEVLASELDTWVEKSVLVDMTTEDSSLYAHDENLGFYINFIFASGGADDLGAVGVWESSALLSTPNQVNLVETAGNYIRITGIRCNDGTKLNSFVTSGRSYADEFRLCQRYYIARPDTLYIAMNKFNQEVYLNYMFPVTMRATPVRSQTSTNCATNSFSASKYGVKGYGLYTGSSGTPSIVGLTFDAEL